MKNKLLKVINCIMKPKNISTMLVAEEINLFMPIDQ